jgi:imidazolonepropionase-like amidohydrolase
MAHRTASLVFALVAILGCGSRPSVDVRRPADPPPATWIRNVSVLDVAAGTTLPRRDVVLSDGRVAAIGATGQVEVPPDALEISGEGATLLPGLIDVHGHVDGDPAPTWEGRFPDIEANLRGYLYAGVTTIFDPADATPDAYERRERVARGELVGPWIYTTGPLHTPPEGHPIAVVREFAPWWIEWYVVPRVAVSIDSEAAAEKAVDEVARNGADAVKIVIDAIPLDAPRMSREVAAAVVRRAASHDLRVVAHIGTTEDAIDAAEAGVAAWVHGVYKERIPEAQIAQLVGYDIPMVVTLEVFDRYARAAAGPRVPTVLETQIAPASLLETFYPAPEGFEVGSLQPWLDLVSENRSAGAENVRRLHRAGMTVLAGSDMQSGVFPGAGLHRELALLVAAGLSPAEAIRAATLDAARFVANDPDPDFGSASERTCCSWRVTRAPMWALSRTCARCSSRASPWSGPRWPRRADPGLPAVAGGA